MVDSLIQAGRPTAPLVHIGGQMCMLMFSLQKMEEGKVILVGVACVELRIYASEKIRASEACDLRSEEGQEECRETKCI